MKKSCSIVLLACSCVVAQPKPTRQDFIPAGVKPTAVVAQVNGQSVTAYDFAGMLERMNPQGRAAALQDPQRFFSELAEFNKVLAIAEREKIDQQSPTKEMLTEVRNRMLVNTKVNQVGENTQVSPQDQKKYYDSHQNLFHQTKVKVIYLPTQAQPGAVKTVVMTDAQAKAKADALVKQARGGADFAKLAIANSKDPGTAKNGGDLNALVRWNSQEVPDVLRGPIMMLKQGEVSEPVRVNSGYYIFKAMAVTPIPFDTVKNDVAMTMKQEALKKWLDDIRKQTSSKVDDPEFFKKASSQAQIRGLFRQ